MPYTFLLLLYWFFLLPKPDVTKEKDLPVPPGGRWLQDNLYLDETELTNIHWLEYLYHLQRDSSTAHYTAALPDTMVWEKVDVTGHLKKYYLRAPAYRFHPVVGISYEQVMNYCIWRSAAATAAFNKDPRNKKKYNLQEYEVVFRWRLPTADEWELAAARSMGTKRTSRKQSSKPAPYSIIDSLGHSRPDKQPALERFLAQHRDTAVNCLKRFEPGYYYGLLLPDKVYPTAPKRSVQVNGQYAHLLGNVAEMTQQKGVAKGGSWAHRLEQVAVTKVNSYETPTAWLGARCIAKVYLKPRNTARP